MSLAVLQREPEPLWFLLAVLGVVFPLLAWGLTRKPREASVIEPLPLPAVLRYLVVFSLLVLGWCAAGI